MSSSYLTSDRPMALNTIQMYISNSDLALGLRTCEASCPPSISPWMSPNRHLRFRVSSPRPLTYLSQGFHISINDNHYPSAPLPKPFICIVLILLSHPALYPIQKQTLTFLPPKHTSDPPSSLQVTHIWLDTVFSHVYYWSKLWTSFPISPPSNPVCTQKPK